MVAFGNDVHFCCMSTEESFGTGLQTGHYVTANDACSLCIDCTCEQSIQLLANLNLIVLWCFHFATSKCNGAGKIDCAGLHETTKEDNFFCTECPYHFTLVDGAYMIDLNTDVACRSGTVEDVHFAILCLCQRLCCLLCAYAKINLGEFCQSRDTCLELCLLTFECILEVLAERHAVEGTHEDCLWRIFRICHYIIGTLTQESKQTALQHKGLNVALCVELACFLLLVSLHTDAQQFTTVAAFHHADCSADRAHELHFGMHLVYKQGITSLYDIALLANHLRFHACEIIWHECILAGTIHCRCFLCGFALEIDVEAFA